MMHRRPGSIGMRQFPGHVQPARRCRVTWEMCARTVQNLEVVRIVPEREPHPREGECARVPTETSVIVRSSVKKRKSA